MFLTGVPVLYLVFRVPNLFASFRQKSWSGQLVRLSLIIFLSVAAYVGISKYIDQYTFRHSRLNFAPIKVKLIPARHHSLRQWRIKFRLCQIPHKFRLQVGFKPYLSYHLLQSFPGKFCQQKLASLDRFFYLKFGTKSILLLFLSRWMILFAYIRLL